MDFSYWIHDVVVVKLEFPVSSNKPLLRLCKRGEEDANKRYLVTGMGHNRGEQTDDSELPDVLHEVYQKEIKERPESGDWGVCGKDRKNVSYIRCWYFLDLFVFLEPLSCQN